MQRLQYLYEILKDHAQIAEWLTAHSPHHMLIEQGDRSLVWIWTWRPEQEGFRDWNQEFLDQWAGSVTGGAINVVE